MEDFYSEKEVLFENWVSGRRVDLKLSGYFSGAVSITVNHLYCKTLHDCSTVYHLEDQDGRTIERRQRYKGVEHLFFCQNSEGFTDENRKQFRIVVKVSVCRFTESASKVPMRPPCVLLPMDTEKLLLEKKVWQKKSALNSWWWSKDVSVKMWLVAGGEEKDGHSDHVVEMERKDDGFDYESVADVLGWVFVRAQWCWPNGECVVREGPLSKPCSGTDKFENLKICLSEENDRRIVDFEKGDYEHHNFTLCVLHIQSCGCYRLCQYFNANSHVDLEQSKGNLQHLIVGRVLNMSATSIELSAPHPLRKHRGSSSSSSFPIPMSQDIFRDVLVSRYLSRQDRCNLRRVCKAFWYSIEGPSMIVSRDIRYWFHYYDGKFRRC